MRSNQSPSSAGEWSWRRHGPASMTARNRLDVSAWDGWVALTFQPTSDRHYRAKRGHDHVCVTSRHGQAGCEPQKPPDLPSSCKSIGAPAHHTCTEAAPLRRRTAAEMSATTMPTGNGSINVIAAFSSGRSYIALNACICFVVSSIFAWLAPDVLTLLMA
jgi:hypothetical protein